MAKNRNNSAPRGVAPKDVAPQDVNVITCNNQLTSPLLSLPGEIRNRIYEYVFAD
ncbi:hypothetical protein G6011_02952 [Alternaria panax]|uniref:Uncharacterized protein n=1 Tax=Alternaria panax TaxID=48097 RepID=A0AAD4FB69_9PLEO|nr:hypothetical protein G6011_02952 [Alternaria panax]